MVVVVFLIIFSVVITKGISEFRSPDGQVASNSSNTLSSVVSIYQKHGVLTLINDETNVEMASEVSYLLQTHPQMMFTYHQVHTALVPVMENLMEHASLEHMREQLQFLVVCELTCVEHLFMELESLDEDYGQGSLLRHFSTWLIISHDDLRPLNTSLDNVVWIQIKKHPQLNIQVNEIIGLNTLLWMPGGREWSNIPLGEFTDCLSYKMVFPNINRGLNARELVVTAMEWTVFAIRKFVNGKVTYTGVAMNLFDNLKRKYNFSYTIVEPEDKLWGQGLDNGTVTGMLGLLYNKKAHLCPVPYSITESRMRIVDFSPPLGPMEYILVYKKNPEVNHLWFFLISTYSWPVYLVGASSLLLLVTGLFCLDHIQKGTTSLDGDSRDHPLYFDIILRVPFRQDLHVIPRATSSRIIIFTWSLFCLMFAAVYVSNLVALSAVEKEVVPFSNLAELAEQTDYQVILDEGTYVELLLKETKDPLLKSIYKRTVTLTSENGSFEERINNLIETLMKDKSVGCVSQGMLRSLLAKSCDFSHTQSVFTRTYGLLFPKHSPLLRLFDVQFLTLKAMGLNGKMEKDRWPKEKKCPKTVYQPKFTVKHLKSGLVATCCCIFISALVLLIEMKKMKTSYSLGSFLENGFR